jgi:hypothetical protein
MLYSTLLFLSFCMDFGIAETGIARGSPPGTTTEVLRVGFPSEEIRVVSASVVPDNVEASFVPDNVEGSGDTASTLPPSVLAEEVEPVEWAELTILQEFDDDGDAKEAAHEDKIYEAIFKVADERALEVAREAIPIPGMTAEMQDDMAEAAVSC